MAVIFTVTVRKSKLGGLKNKGKRQECYICGIKRVGKKTEGVFWSEQPKFYVQLVCISGLKWKWSVKRFDFKSQMLGTVFFPVGNIFESTIKQLLVRFLYGMENYADLKECYQPRLKVKLLINTR